MGDSGAEKGEVGSAALRTLLLLGIFPTRNGGRDYPLNKRKARQQWLFTTRRTARTKATSAPPLPHRGPQAARSMRVWGEAVGEPGWQRGGGDWPAACRLRLLLGMGAARSGAARARFPGRAVPCRLSSARMRDPCELSRKVRIASASAAVAGCGTTCRTRAVLRYGEGNYLLRCAGREAERLCRGA